MKGVWGRALGYSGDPQAGKVFCFLYRLRQYGFSASVYLVLSASLRDPFACLALVAIAFDLAAACLLISRVWSNW
jgi:hypothetical protein